MADAPSRVNSIVFALGIGQTNTMRPIVFFALMAGVVTACAPLSLYYRPGAEVARLQTDTTNCEVAALKDAPVAMKIRQSPPVFYPGRYYCDGYGSCWRGGSYWVDGPVYSVDVNADLRRRVTDQCMADKGYAPVEVPLCPNGTHAPVAATTVLPTLTPNSCALRHSDGSFTILQTK